MKEDFIKTITNNPKETFYHAICLLKNGDIGITPNYTKETLKLYLEDIKNNYVKVLKIEKEEK